MLNSLPPATRAILVANALLFVVDYLLGHALLERLALWPLATPRFQPWQLVTYSFMHGSFAHIFFNMFAVYMFGRALEDVWGARRFLVFYFASVLAAAITQLIVQQMSGSGAPTLGASGGVFGVLLAFAMLFPRQRITLLFPPIPMPAWLFVTLYGILELVLGVTNTQAGVAHFAHLGGMVGGALVILFWRTKQPTRRF